MTEPHEDPYSPETICYNPKIHGTLEDYVLHRQADPLFNNPKYFDELKEAGLLRPGSGIRVMHSMFGFDEAYWVNNDFRLEGIPGKFAGKPGIHEPEEILKDQNWEFLH